MEALTLAEKATLQFWHKHVRSYSPTLRRYDPQVHTINRTMLYYFMTEDLMEYLKECGIVNYTEEALLLMHVSSGTLTNWRKKWGKTWRTMHIFEDEKHTP